MNITYLQKNLAVVVMAGLVWSAAPAWADPPANGTAGPMAVSSPALQLSAGALRVLQLSQAKVSDDIIINFIRQSKIISYGLDANQIVYLRQQGVSNPVISAMVNQPSVMAVVPPTGAAQATVYYDDPFYYPYGYYGYYDPFFSYGFYPRAGFYWGGGWHGAGPWHAGGWRHGGGFHGGHGRR